MGNRWLFSVGSDQEPQLNRRRFLKTGGSVLVAGLAGCTGRLNDSSGGEPVPASTPSKTPTSTPSPTPSPSPTETEEPTQTKTSTPAPPGNFKFDFTPADTSADYAVSPLFDDPEIEFIREYELDLDDLRSKHFDDFELWTKPLFHPELEEFYHNIDNDQWVQNFLTKVENKYNLSPDREKPTEYDFTWQRFQEASDFRERVVDTDFGDLWYLWEGERLGSISSGNNEFKAATWQKIWRDKLESDAYIFAFTLPAIDNGHVSGSHGNGAAIQNPADYPDNYDSKELYQQALDEQKTNIMETGPQASDHRNHQAIQIKDADYLQEGTWEWEEYWHPALFDGTTPRNGDIQYLDYEAGKKRVENAFFSLIANTGDEWELDGKIVLTNDFATAFADWLQNPTQTPAQQWIDYAAATYGIGHDKEYQDTNLVVGRSGIYSITDPAVIDRINTEPGQTYDDLDAVVAK